MPSGAKKRKAAKKKKESEVKGASHLPNSTSIPAPHPHGEEDLKHHDDKDSDGGEVSSPASQDNRNQDQFMEGEDSLLDQSSGLTSEGEQMEKKVIVEEESVIRVERELKALDEPQEKNIHVECIESSRGSHEGGSLKSSISSSSSSSSDDESDAANKNKIVEANYPTVVVNELDSISAAKVSDSIPETETCNSAEVGAVTSIELDKTAVSGEMIQVEKNASDNDNMTSYAILSELIKNEKKKSGVDDEIPSVSEEVLVDLGSQTKDNESVQTSHDTAAETLHGKDSGTQENGVKPTPAYDTPKVDVSTGADPVKDSEVPECSDSEPPVGSALRPVQTTSWKGCCGLFELFTGSSR